jgi:hypothetical protein
MAEERMIRIMLSDSNGNHVGRWVEKEQLRKLLNALDGTVRLLDESYEKSYIIVLRNLLEEALIYMGVEQ